MISGSISGTPATPESLRSTPGVSRICGRAAEKRDVSPFVSLPGGVVEEGRPPRAAAGATATRVRFSVSRVLTFFPLLNYCRPLYVHSTAAAAAAAALEYTEQETKEAGGGLIMGWNIIKY